MTTSLSATSHLKLKTLVLAVSLAAAGAVHAPRAEAQFVVIDPAAIARMGFDELANEARRMIRECFDVKNLKQAMDRVQAIQRINLRSMLNSSEVKLSETMTEREPMEGAAAACPDPSGGSLVSMAAGSLRDAIGLGASNLDGSTDLRAEQMKLCGTTVYLRNQKWNAERRVLVELERQTETMLDIMRKWNEKASEGGGSASGSPLTGCSLDGSGGPNEGWQQSAATELQANLEQSDRMFKQVQAEVDIYQSVIVSLEQRQSQVAQMMLSGRTENSNFISGAAAGAIQATLLKGALDNARTD